MTFNEIRKKVFEINSQLFDMGYTYQDIIKFWDELFEEVPGSQLTLF